MSLKVLADKDELGNSVAHFFKSGNVLRSKQNDALAELKSLIPKTWTNGTRVEYDVWYNFAGDRRIHGYVYTDVLTQFLYLRVASEGYALQVMRDAANAEITNEGEALFKSIAKDSNDKYRLRSSEIRADFVVFLPGTNILNKVVNWGKIDNAVSQGAKLKCHPLTAASAYEHLVHKYGDAVIGKKFSGHELLEQAAIVGCCDNSEMGLAALAKGKTVYRFGRDKQWCTYSAIYSAISDRGVLSAERFKSVLSSKESGLIPCSIGHPQERINGFFNRYKQEEHIAPRNFSNRVQQANRTNG